MESEQEYQEQQDLDQNQEEEHVDQQPFEAAQSANEEEEEQQYKNPDSHSPAYAAPLSINGKQVQEVDDFSTPENYQKDNQELDSQRSMTKQLKKTKTFIGSKNFVEMNLKVKTKQEIQLEVNEKKKMRMSHLSDRKSQMSQMGSRMSLVGKEETQQPLEWSKLVIRNQIAETRQPASIAYQKNQSKDYLTKTVESSGQANSLGQVFSQSRKEQAWQRTNASGINLLPSHRTLDAPKKQEGDLVPQLLANVELKQNLNLKSQLDNHNWVGGQDKPQDYQAYQEKQIIVHNINNTHVQAARHRTFTSNVF